MTRVCVEVNLGKSLPKRIWIGQGDLESWQPIIYEDLLTYCLDCLRIGHPFGNCDNDVAKLPKACIVKVWRPKEKNPTLASLPLDNTTTILPSSSGVSHFKKATILVDLSTLTPPHIQFTETLLPFFISSVLDQLHDRPNTLVQNLFIYP